MPYQVTKKYGHDLGLSCCFRQPNAKHSHCSKLHGYALGFEIVFESNTLDGRNWVMDFGGLKPLRGRLGDLFDHKTVISETDPHLDAFRILHNNKVIDLVVMPKVGCEAFARTVYDEAKKLVDQQNEFLERSGHIHRVKLVSVTCAEHGANSATYIA